MQYLTPKAVAERMDVKVETVWEWLRTGKIQGRKYGKIWRISEESYQEFTASGMQVQGIDESMIRKGVAQNVKY